MVVFPIDRDAIYGREKVAMGIHQSPSLICSMFNFKTVLLLVTESKQSLAVGKELVNLGYFSAESGTGGIYLKMAMRKRHKWVWF